jgi:hypothetical protein
VKGKRPVPKLTLKRHLKAGEKNNIKAHYTIAHTARGARNIIIQKLLFSRQFVAGELLALLTQ